jgi:hypothetical protein
MCFFVFSTEKSGQRVGDLHWCRHNNEFENFLSCELMKTTLLKKLYFRIIIKKMTRSRSRNSNSISMNHVSDVISQRSRKESRTFDTDRANEKPDGG